MEDGSNQPADRPRARMSVEAEASLMNRGRGRSLTYMIGGSVLVIALGVLLIRMVGRGDAYSEAEADTARIGQEHFDGYFACALPGSRASELNADRVQAELQKLGERMGKAYAKTLASCVPRVQALDKSVQALRVPKPVMAQHAELVAASSALVTANTQYLQYLSQGDGNYERGTALPMLKKIGGAFAGYRAAEGNLDRALAQRL